MNEDIFDDLPENTSAIEEAGKMGKILIDLKSEMDEAEELFNEKKAAYEKYAQETMPAYFASIGVSEMTIDNHFKLKVTEKAYMSPVKNGEKKAEWLQWLKDNGGEDLVKKELNVKDPEEELIKLATALGYSVEENANTTSIKALITEKLGMKKAVATITIDDVPKGLNLYLKKEIEVKAL